MPHQSNIAHALDHSARNLLNPARRERQHSDHYNVAIHYPHIDKTDYLIQRNLLSFHWTTINNSDFTTSNFTIFLCKLKLGYLAGPIEIFSKEK